jgi:hypothetical protein
MTTSKQMLFWAPRALCIAFILFVSMFALDAFEEGRGFWLNLAAFLVHLIPTYILAAMLVLAWRWEWIGAVVPTVLALLFLWWDHRVRHNTLIAVLMLVGPLFLMAALFLMNWFKRDELHGKQ